MIKEARLIGEKIVNTKLVSDFRKLQSELEKHDDKTLENFFYYSRKIRLQFEGYMKVYTILLSEKPEFTNEIKDLKYFVENRCARLSLVLTLIIHLLNYPEIGTNTSPIVKNLYIPVGIDNNSINDIDHVKESLKIFSEEENIDELFSAIISLKNSFLDSDIFRIYKEYSANNDNKLKDVELNISALFYIIKQIIYQYIVDNTLKCITDDNIIKCIPHRSLEGYFLDVKYQPSNDLNLILEPSQIIEIFYKNKKALCYITKINFNFSQEKGSIINIEGEKIFSNGLNLNSPHNTHLDTFLKKYG